MIGLKLKIRHFFTKYDAILIHKTDINTWDLGKV